MSTDSIKKRAANGAGWMTLEMLGIQATLFGVFVAISHFVEPRDFGLINISYLSVQMLQMLVLYNVDTAVARKQAFLLTH
jgi:O-antigen/teichoic acid export membrane protein